MMMRLFKRGVRGRTKSIPNFLGVAFLLSVSSVSAFAQVNLAQGKPIWSSSSVDIYSATNANDGDQGTYWESANNAFPQSLTVDLGSVFLVEQLNLKLPEFWEARTQTLSISGSEDGATFSSLQTSSDYIFDSASNNVVTIDIADQKARYIRLVVLNNTGWAAGQISEIEVIGLDDGSEPRDAFSQIDAASFDAMMGIQTETTTDQGGGMNVGWIDHGDWLLFREVNFGDGATRVDARVASDHAGGSIEFRLGSPTGQLIGSVDVAYTGGWQSWVTENTAVSVSGVHDLYTVFTGTGAGSLFNANWFQFSTEDVDLPPQAPEGLVANSVTANSVSLSWNAVADANSYEVLRNGAVVSSTSSSSFVDRGLTENTDYSYQVRAINTAGASPLSSALMVMTDDTIIVNPDARNVTGSATLTASSTLSHLSPLNMTDGNQASYWESNNNAFPQHVIADLGALHFISHLVLMLPNDLAWEARTQTLSVSFSENGVDYSQLTGPNGYLFDPTTGNTVTISFADNAARYIRIEVTANTAWPAAQFSELEIWGAPEPIPPSTPTGLSVIGGTSNSLTLGWNAVPLASSYEVWRDGVSVATTNSTSFSDTGLMPVTSYSYSVSAINEFGTSPLTSAIVGTTPATNPEPPVGRGASMPYQTYQAEDSQFASVGNGAAVIGDVSMRDREIGTIAGEASGRRAVVLDGTGEFVEFVTEHDTNTLVTRFVIPDAVAGGGIDATLSVYINEPGGSSFDTDFNLTSKHAWLYGAEASPSNSPGAGEPRHIYDEGHIVFDHILPAGTRIRLQKDASDAAAYYGIDFVSLEVAAPPLPNPDPNAYLVPNGFTHQAVQTAIDEARMGTWQGVYLPPGNYEILRNYDVFGRGIDIVGAGVWHTRFVAPEGQRNTGVGFNIRSGADGARLADFAVFGNYDDRIDGPGKTFHPQGVSNITLENLWVEHQIVFVWGVDLDNSVIRNSRARNLFADGINMTNSSSGNLIKNIETRSTGDDSFALFSQGSGPNTNNTFENLTSMTTWRAAGLAVYGGNGNVFRDIVIEDTLVYSGITVSSLDFGLPPFHGFTPTTNFEEITIDRCGGHFWGAQTFPGLWMFSADESFMGLRFKEIDILDPTYHGIMFQTKYDNGQRQQVFDDVEFDGVRISGARVQSDYPTKSGFGIWANPLPEAGQGPAVGVVNIANLVLSNNQINIETSGSPEFILNLDSGPTDPPDPTLISTGKSISASSQLDFLPVENLVDGNLSSYWQSSTALPQAVTIDLGSSFIVNRVVLKLPNGWETRTQTIEISQSTDGNSYTTLLPLSDYVFDTNLNNTVDISFPVVTTRFLRLTITSNTAWNAGQLSELEAYGSPEPIPPGAPQNFRVAGVSSDSVFLAWQSDPLATAHAVYRDGALVGTVSGAAGSFEDIELTPLTTYDYFVVSSNQFGEAQATAAISATTAEIGEPNPEPGPIIGVPGANFPFVRYDSEKDSGLFSGPIIVETTVGFGNGAVLMRNAANPFNQDFTSSEASNQQYVALPLPGSYVEWEIQAGKGGDGVTMRYTMRDSNDGFGEDGVLDILVNGQAANIIYSTSRPNATVGGSASSIPVTSYYGWQYFDGGGIPNDAPGGGEPLFRFDEVHFKLAQPLVEGDIIRIVNNDRDVDYGIDFIEVENVPAPIGRPSGSVSVADHGATPDDGYDDLAAFEAAVDAVVATNSTLYIPPGTYELGNMWVIGEQTNLLENMTIMGAGIWHTNIQFTNPNSRSGGVSLRVAGELDFSHVYLNSNLRSRYNQEAVYKGFMDNFGQNSKIHNVWVEHFEAGLWVGDYRICDGGDHIASRNLTIENSRIRNNLADGINFSQGTSDSISLNNDVRNNGDDGLAVWSGDTCGANIISINNKFNYNTLEFIWRAAAVAFHGGANHEAKFNFIRDLTGSSGYRLTTDFPGFLFETNDEIVLSDSVLVRTGTSKATFRGERGAFDYSAARGPISNVTVRNMDIIDTQRSALQLGFNSGYQGILFEDIRIDGTGMDGQTTSRFSLAHEGARIYIFTSSGSATFRNISESRVANPNTDFIINGFNAIVE